MENVLLWQWLTVIGVSIILFFLAPWSNTPQSFFQATKNNQQPSWFLLTSSLVISWIFAKSITNAANLGLSFGFVGGVAYAGYYFSFIVAGIIIYQLRTKGGFSSIHQFLQTRYGRSAVIVFSLLIGFRLFNEVWSNTMVIGTYFGEQGSTSYYSAIIVFTLLTLAYSLKGGLSSSLLTDAIQMALFGVLLFIILGVLIPKTEGGLTTYLQSGEWSWATGVNLLFVAVLQSLSYPFHDPVLTDRGFISSAKTTLKAYLWAAPIGGTCILLFSFVGIYAQKNGMEGQAAVEVSKTLGVFMMLIMNFIMVTSAASTLDSTFASFSKLAVVDLGREARISVSRGRLAMVVLTIIGTIPVFLSPEILSATTVSGTMVIGLAPVFIFWQRKAKPIAFHLSIGLGVILGLALVMNWIPTSLILFPGKYGDLLSVNLLGTIGCFLIFLIAGTQE